MLFFFGNIEPMLWYRNENVFATSKLNFLKPETTKSSSVALVLLRRMLLLIKVRMTKVNNNHF